MHLSGAKKVIVADIDLKAAEEVAHTIDGSASRCDVAQEADIKLLIEKTELEFGPVDLYCSNAGVALGFSSPVDNAAAGPDDLWQTAWSINVMGHVYAARHLVPRMKARGGGYFLVTVSAAGLLTQVGSAIVSRRQSTPRSGLPKIWQSRTRMTESKYQFFVRRPWTHRCCIVFRKARNLEMASCLRNKSRRLQLRGSSTRHSLSCLILK